MRVADPALQHYLQGVVEHQASVTSVFRYDSWLELPWDKKIGPPRPIPAGAAFMVGLRSKLAIGGDEVFVVLPDADRENLALNLAAQIVKAFRRFPVDA